jgi:hypothetical protein
MRIRCTIAALAFGLALAAAPAQASDRTIAFEVRLADRAPECAADDAFGLAFDMVSASGAPLGSGQSCVHSSTGCEPFTPFCRTKVDATFTLAFKRGSLTAPMTLRELMPSDSVVLQQGSGRIASGTGEFSGARGRVEGGGIIAFTDAAPVTKLFYAVRLERRG